MMDTTPFTPPQPPLPDPVGHSRKKNWLVIGLVGMGVLMLLSVAVLFSLIVFSGGQDDSAKKERASSLTDELTKNGVTTTPERTTITSTLGYSFSYDPVVLLPYGQVNDAARSSGSMVYYESFSGDELKETRPYSMITLKPQGNDTDLASPDLVISTNIRRSFWDRFKDNPDYPSKRDSLLVNYIAESYKDEKTTASKVESTEVGGATYQIIRLTRDNSHFGVSAATETKIYATVQNDRPYWAVLTNVTANPTLTSEFESVIASLTYKAVDDSLLGRTSSDTVTLAAADLPKDTSYVPEKLDSDSIIPVVLRNQPAVVRILTVRCGAPTLVNGSKRVSLPKSCEGGVGSGSFISSDGYIATNGHVVTLDNSVLLTKSLRTVEAVKTVLDFLVDRGTITDQQRTAFLSALSSGDPAAQQAVLQLPQVVGDENMTVERDLYSYGIQTSNQPIRVQDDYTISYNDTILPATLVDKDYDPITASKAIHGEGAFTSSDVAILKAKGEFPTVPLARAASLQEGDKMTAIGYPGFVDNNIRTDQWQTVPTITQGTATAIASGYPYGGRVIQTNAQIAPGNSGGPAFNAKGEQVGLMTYGNLNCSDQRCFGNGSFRDIEDIHSLVRKNNITLSEGTIAANWHKGLDAYEEGNYKLALEQFDSVKRAYPANYLAPELSRIARANVGTPTDSSDSLNVKALIVVAAITTLSLGAAAVVILVILLVRHQRPKEVRIDPATYRQV